MSAEFQLVMKCAPFGVLSALVLKFYLSLFGVYVVAPFSLAVTHMAGTINNYVGFTPFLPLSTVTRMATNTASSFSAFGKQKIIACKWVSLLTVCLSGSLARRRASAQRVFLVGHKFQVAWIATSRVSAKVVKFIACIVWWQRVHQPRIGDAVCFAGLAVPMKSAIAAASYTARPNPTRQTVPVVFPANLNFGEQAANFFKSEMFYGKILVSHSLKFPFKLWSDPFGCAITRSGRFAF